MKKGLVLTSLVATAFFAVAPAHSATLKVLGGITCATTAGIGFDQTSVGSNLPALSNSVDRSDRGCSGAAEAIADGGYVGGLSRARTDEIIPGQLSSTSSFNASTELNYRITKPDDYTGGDIPVYVNAVFDAILESTAFYNPVDAGLFSQAISQVGYNLLVSGNNTDGTTSGTSITRDLFELRADNILFDDTYALNSVRILEENIKTPTLMLDPNVDIRVRFTVFGSVSGTGIYAGAANSLNTFSFDPDDVAFNLPDGFIINSAEGNIVNNRFIDPRGTPPPSTVPLPANGLLTLTAMAGLMLVRRRQRRAD